MHPDDLTTLLRLNQGARVERLLNTGWRVEGRALGKGWRLSGDQEPQEAFLAVWALARAHDHHPEVTVGYASLRVTLTTHDTGGLSERDLALAEAIEGLEVILRAAPAQPS